MPPSPLTFFLKYLVLGCRGVVVERIGMEKVVARSMTRVQPWTAALEMLSTFWVRFPPQLTQSRNILTDIPRGL